jgi:hypothetical protein
MSRPRYCTEGWEQRLSLTHRNIFFFHYVVKQATSFEDSLIQEVAVNSNKRGGESICHRRFDSGPDERALIETLYAT